ncbi:MAG: XRE family transcriptional regulator [Ruminococcaceae bacterium]|nr:XRE family transcriptional regulator [Oscillospiraceae bacterium]
MPPVETLPYISTRTYSAFWCGSVKVVGAKKPEDSLLCACDMDTLTDGERLKVLRLHAGLTIRQAAEAVGICRHTLMNYESGRSEVKPEVRERLTKLYSVR